MTEINPGKEIVFGAVSGMVGKLVEFPLDTIKVRLQSTDVRLPTYKMIQSTYTNEGIVNGFYKGLKAPLVGASIETAVLFASYNWASSHFNRHYAKGVEDFDIDSDVPLWTRCASGGFSGFAAAFVLTPIELVKCQLQVSNLSSRTNVSYMPLIRSIIRQDGFHGLWKGLGSTLTREVFGTSIWFGTYEYMTAAYREHPVVSHDWQLVISGAVAGAMFNLTMFPIDTIKSNIQTHDMLHSSSEKTTFWQTTKMLAARKGGLRNFYRGLGITLVRAIPANALIFYCYELLKRNF